jgi:hypothetical protein
MDTKDVDLDELLGEKPEVEEKETPGASAEKPAEAPADGGGTGGSPDLSPRAQERIKTLLEENKGLKEALQSRNSSQIDTFINSIQDEPSRNLLKQFGSLLLKDVETRFQPALSQYNDDRFEREFSQYASKIPALADHKEDIRKTFKRNPSQSLKSIVGDALVDIQSAAIKPVESAPSAVNRTQRPDASGLADKSTDELYDILETQRPPIG